MRFTYKPSAARLRNPSNYLPDDGLEAACTVALLLGQPLLLTGEPGTGKTQFASYLAHQLGFGEELRFNTKSTSTARDLFYRYDALQHFKSESGRTSPLPYIAYQALGVAILRSRERDEIADFITPAFDHGGKRASVVLIDEIDKAPRDFPNDLLNNLEREEMAFEVPELSIPEAGTPRVQADPDLRPVVVITSNSEKDLPDAFLRRCIYYNIPFPDRPRLREIIVAHLGEHAAGNNELLDAALDLFFLLRGPLSGLRKKPATAELLGWLLALIELDGGAAEPVHLPELAERTLGSLVKTKEDQERAREIVREWQPEPS